VQGAPLSAKIEQPAINGTRRLNWTSIICCRCCTAKASEKTEMA
jgi:hypothetical protein